MPDVLIRNLPDDVLAAIDAKARTIGLSRTEHIRRTLSRERVEATEAVRAKDLVVFADTFAGLADDDVIRQGPQGKLPTPTFGPHARRVPNSSYRRPRRGGPFRARRPFGESHMGARGVQGFEASRPNRSA